MQNRSVTNADLVLIAKCFRILFHILHVVSLTLQFRISHFICVLWYSERHLIRYLSVKFGSSDR